MKTAAYLVVLAALAAGACRQDEPARTTSPAPAPPAAEPAIVETTAISDSVLVGDPPTLVAGPLREPPADWTTRTTSVSRRGGVATLTDIRTGSHGPFDRIVLTLVPAIPGYHIEYVDRPAFECGSGEAVYLEGDAWLLLRLSGAHAHDETGSSSIDQRVLKPRLPVLREGRLTCDFEAEVAWVFGLEAPGGYRVSELAGPPRLVVDVQR